MLSIRIRTFRRSWRLVRDHIAAWRLSQWVGPGEQGVLLIGSQAALLAGHLPHQPRDIEIPLMVRSDCGSPELVDTAPWLMLADNGCRYAPSCLTCPFVRCRYDERGGIPGARRQERDAEIRRLREEGQAPAVIAQQVGISLRSVYRIVAVRV